MLRLARRFCPAIGLLGLLAAGCWIMPLPPNSDNDNGSGGGGGGGSTPPPPPPSATRTFTFSNESASNLSLSYSADGGPLQTIDLNAGQLFAVMDLQTCICFTVQNFTPPNAQEVEGFSLQLCEDAQATFTNASGPFGGVAVSLAGGGSPTGLLTYTLSNTSSKTVTIFEFINGAVQPSFNLSPNEQQQLSVDRCVRLRVLARDPLNQFPDVEFVESPATIAAVYTYQDGSNNDVEVVKQP